MDSDKAEVVGVVREWKAQHEASLTNIHAQIDAWGRRPGEPPVRDYAEVEAAVDRLTRRVKTRKVTVEETVTDYVEVADEPAPADAGPVLDEPGGPEPAQAPKRRFAWFSRRKKDGAEAGAPTEAQEALVATPTLPPPAPAEDAWDPGQGRAIEAPKPLQSRAAKRTARQATKKGARKKR